MRKLFTYTDTTVREVKSGNGVTTVFPLVMEFFLNGDLVLNLVIAATGVKTLQAITTDYTLSGGSGASGTVTMVVAPPTGTNLVIERKQPGTQAIDYEPNSPIPAETIEEGLDRNAMLAGQAKEVADRALVFPIDEVLAAGDGEVPALAVRKSTRLGFDSAGKPIAITNDITGVAATAFGASLMNDVDAAEARTTLEVANDIREVTVQVFSASGTYTKPADLLFAIVEVLGGGAGGGGCGSTGAGQEAGAGGGGAGGYAREVLTAAAIGATETVTVGSLGAGGVAGPNGGSNGGTSSFGALLSATGGTGGFGAEDATGPGGPAGAGSGDDIGGGRGDAGLTGLVNQTDDTGTGGQGGGAAPFGAGGIGRLASSSQTLPGQDAQGFASGGSGASNGASQAAAAGGDATAGIIIVTEFKS